MQQIKEIGTRLLFSYGVHNTLEWLLRDWVQNMVDGAKEAGVMDPVAAVKAVTTATVEQTATVTVFDQQEMVISGPSWFHSDYLLFMGATTKTGRDDQIGEKGEGTKITTLMAMRDFGLGVTYRAWKNGNGWEAKAVAKEITLGDKTEHELVFLVHEYHDKNKLKPGSEVVLTGASVAQLASLKFQDWFASPNNPHLQPENRVQEGLYKPVGAYGRAFLAGLDRGEDPRCTFVYNVPGKVSGDNDRDRGNLKNDILVEGIITLFQMGMTQEVFSALMQKHKEGILNGYSSDPEPVALNRWATPETYDKFGLEALGGNLDGYTWGRNYDSHWKYRNEIKRLGLIMVQNYEWAKFLERNGVKSVEDWLEDLQDQENVQPNELEVQQIKKLRWLADAAGLNSLPVKLQDSPESAVMGSYHGSYVRMQRTVLAQFGTAWGTYLHEISHFAGNDESAAFSDQLTKAIIATSMDDMPLLVVDTAGSWLYLKKAITPKVGLMEAMLAAAFITEDTDS